MARIVASQFDTVMNASEIKVPLRRIKPIAGAASMPIIDADHRSRPEPLRRSDCDETTPGSQIENRFVAAPADHSEHTFADVELAPNGVGEHGGADSKAQAPKREQGWANQRNVEITDMK
jgi:hypothetical protein